MPMGQVDLLTYGLHGSEFVHVLELHKLPNEMLVLSRLHMLQLKSVGKENVREGSHSVL